MADDIVVMAETTEELSTMLNDLELPKKWVLKWTWIKPVMVDIHVARTPIKIGDTESPQRLEIVDDYIYLGETVQLGRFNFEKEVNRRIRLSWATFERLSGIFSPNIPHSVSKRKFLTRACCQWWHMAPKRGRLQWASSEGLFIYLRTTNSYIL